MDAATILVVILSVGVIALLAWFEINSRRNDAKLKSTSAQSLEIWKKESQAENQSNAEKKKAA